MHVSAAARNATARKRDSRSAAKFDDRQMLATFDVAHRELDLVNVARGPMRSMGPSRPRLESPPNRRATIVDILRRLPGARHVRAPLVVQVPTGVITRPQSDECVTRGIRCTGRKSSYEAGRRGGKAFFVAKSTMMTSGTTVRSRSGCSIRSSAPGYAVLRNRTLRGMHWPISGACSMSPGRQLPVKR